MSRALLINPSYLRTYGSNEGGLAFPVFPILSLASLAGATIEAGHEARILDLSYRAYDPDVLRRMLDTWRPDVVGVTATTPLMNQARDISFLVKDVAPQTLVIAGGPHPTALPEVSLRQGAFDAVAVGEGDRIVAEVLDSGSVDVAGLRHSGGFRPAELTENLDDLPEPAWGLYPLAGQKRLTRLAARRRPVATVEFSRGCIYNCDFCGSKNTMGRGYRKKSPERCAEELRRLAHLGFREAVVVDDIFTSDNDWAAEVCEAIIRSGVDIAWSCTNGIRVDSANSELFTLMRRAGCYRVYFGLESGNDEILRRFGKGGRATLTQAQTAIAATRAAGIEPNGFFLVGLSADDEKSMDDTLSFARSLDLDTMKCGICVPFPGTPMFAELHDAGLIRSLDWDDYTVYNEADAIFDHPTLPWSTITAYFRRFYRDVYFRNPRYMLRRLRALLLTTELWFSAYYTIKFVLMLWRPRRGPQAEAYAFADRWRPSDVKPGEPLPAPSPPRAAKGGGPGGVDGKVTIVGSRPRARR